MKIIVVGAGLGGLTAAFRFAQRGHEVVVLERSTALTAQGGGMNIRPGASRIFQSWGLAQDMESISMITPHTLLRNMSTGDVAMRNIAVDISDFPDWGVMRQDVVKVLYRKACEAGAQVTFDATVVDVRDDPDMAEVELKDGSRMQADVILAADGIRSKIRSKILSDLDCAKDPIISQTTLYGIQVDAADLDRETGTSRLTDQPNLNCWMGKDGFVITRKNSKLGVVGLLFGINSETDQKGLWDENGDIAHVRAFFVSRGACSDLVKALKVAQSCDRWKLAELPHLPRWTSQSGRILLLGDSAHAMHPNAAQGFSQTIEDVAVMELLISEHSSVMTVPEIAAAWQAVRKPRVERIKEYAKWNTLMFTGALSAPAEDIERRVVKSLKDTRPDMNAKFHNSMFLKWCLDHDALEEAKHFLDKTKSKL